MTELLGYAASIFVALSLVMVSLVKLRIINLIGCLFFVAYGVLIQAWPIVATNGFIVCVNVYYLIRMFRQDTSSFQYAQLRAEEADLVVRFLREKYGDMRRFYPLFAEKMINYAFSGNGLVYGAFRRNRLNGISVLLRLDNLLEYAPRFWTGDDAEQPEGVLELSSESHAESGAGTPGDRGFESQDEGMGNKGDSNAPESETAASSDTNAQFIQILRAVGERKPPESTVLMPADYLVAKYRDLGVVGKFHKRLLADLPQGIDHVVCPVNRSDLGTRRYFQRNGYEKLVSIGEVTVFELDVRHLRAVGMG